MPVAFEGEDLEPMDEFQWEPLDRFGSDLNIVRLQPFQAQRPARLDHQFRTV